MSAELCQQRQQLEAASEQSAASRQAVLVQLRDLRAWAQSAMEAMQARPDAQLPSPSWPVSRCPLCTDAFDRARS